MTCFAHCSCCGSAIVIVDPKENADSDDHQRTDQPALARCQGCGDLLFIREIPGHTCATTRIDDLATARRYTPSINIAPLVHPRG